MRIIIIRKPKVTETGFEKLSWFQLRLSISRRKTRISHRRTELFCNSNKETRECKRIKLEKKNYFEILHDTIEEFLLIKLINIVYKFIQEIMSSFEI